MIMTYEEFVSTLEKAELLTEAIYAHPTYDCNGLPKDELVYYQKITTGGYSGGSCWNDDPAEPFTTDDQFDFEDIADAIEKMGLTLSFKGFSKLIKNCTCEYTENEYYGNSTDYQYVIIRLPDLWDLVNPNKE